MKQPLIACRDIAALALTAATAVAATGMIAAGIPAPGDSVVLSYLAGASPYSGIGRYASHASCTAILLDTSSISVPARPAPAYALTAGDCPVLTGSKEVVIDGAGIGRVVFNAFVDSEHRQLPVPVARTAYATAAGRSLAVLELATSYRELTGRLIRPWSVAPAIPVRIGDPITIVGVPLGSAPGESFLRATNCQAGGEPPVEEAWPWFDVPFNRCRDTPPGSSGSAVIATTTRVVIAILSRTTTGVQTTSVAGIDGCFNRLRRFDITQPACPLDAAPTHDGPTRAARWQKSEGQAP
jgi:hypothetical protein